MATYRKRNQTIEAERFVPNSPLLHGISNDAGGWYIVTRVNGVKVYVTPGDYLLPDGDGWYVVPAFVFEQNYEVVP